MNGCTFCTIAQNDTANLIYEYEHWYLFLQMPEKLKATKQAAGLMISRRHFENVTDAKDDEVTELFRVIKDAGQRLCEKVGVTYTNQETVGFNQGKDAGQTQFHAHVHILPVAEEDPEKLKVRAGIGGAFEALHRERLSSD